MTKQERAEWEAKANEYCEKAANFEMDAAKWKKRAEGFGANLAQTRKERDAGWAQASQNFDLAQEWKAKANKYIHAYLTEKGRAEKAESQVKTLSEALGRCKKWLLAREWSDPCVEAAAEFYLCPDCGGRDFVGHNQGCRYNSFLLSLPTPPEPQDKEARA